MDKKELTHKRLVEIGYRWLVTRGGCGVAIKELNSSACNGEYPDVIGFRSHGQSTLIECKNSRADFLADKNKSFRKTPSLGMGSHRFYLCPWGLINENEIPEGWGLIYVNENGKAVLQKSAYKGNSTFQNTMDKNIVAEHGLMYSVLRRLFIKGHIKHIYDKQYNRLSNSEILKSQSNENEQ